MAITVTTNIAIQDSCYCIPQVRGQSDNPGAKLRLLPGGWSLHLAGIKPRIIVERLIIKEKKSFFFS